MGAHPILNTSKYYIGVCHGSTQHKHIAHAARVGSAPPNWELLDPDHCSRPPVITYYKKTPDRTVILTPAELYYWQNINKEQVNK